jgi:hypothetical protein
MAAPPPDWLTKAWAGAKRRGLDALTPDEINAEIAAHRHERNPLAARPSDPGRYRYQRPGLRVMGRPSSICEHTLVRGDLLDSRFSVRYTRVHLLTLKRFQIVSSVPCGRDAFPLSEGGNRSSLVMLRWWVPRTG